MTLTKSLSGVVFGNLSLALALILLAPLLGQKAAIINVAGASIVFLIVTVLTLFFANHYVTHNAKASLVGVMVVSSFGRIFVSLLWILIYRQWKGDYDAYRLLEFILIYVFYLIVDVWLLGRIAKSA